MAVNLKGKSNKELNELRLSLHNQAKQFHAANETSWTKECDEKFSAMMADVEVITKYLKDKGEASSRAAGGIDAGAGKRVSDELTVFSQGDSVAKAFGGSDIGLGEVVRAAALGSADPTDGGYTMSTQVASSVIDLARSKSVLTRAGMRFGVMNSSELRMPKLTADPTFQVKIENDEFDEDDTMAFGALNFYPLLIGSYITMSRELAEDSVGFQSVIEQALADAFAVQLDRFPLLGTTADRVRVGLLDDTDIGETGSIGQLAWSDVTTEATTIRGNNHEPTAVLLHPTWRDWILDSRTDSGNGVYLGVPPSLANVQVLESTSITSSKGLVGDFSKLIMVVRGGPIIESTTVGGNSFKKHQIACKIVWRGDFGVTHTNAFRRLAGIS